MFQSAIGGEVKTLRRGSLLPNADVRTVLETEHFHAVWRDRHPLRHRGPELLVVGLDALPAVLDVPDEPVQQRSLVLFLPPEDHHQAFAP
jgi:hypothetical protein